MLTVDYHCNPRTGLRGKTGAHEALPEMVAMAASSAFGGTTLASKCVSTEIRVTM